MKMVECQLESVTPYSQSRYITVPKKERELPDAFEERTWRERCHVNKDGNITIPPMAFSNNIKEAAKFLDIKIPGKRNQTYTKHFEAGVLVQQELVLPIKKDEVRGEWLHVPSDGRRGGGSRVLKCFPLILEWKGNVTYYILDDIITKDIFERALDAGGNLIGIGRFRPRNMGYYGRFKVNEITWVEN